MDPTRQPHRWLMLFGVWVIYMSFGLIAASLAPLVQPISTDLQLDLSAMGGIMGAWPLVYIGSAIPAGAFLDRFGLRWSMLLATLLIAVSAALRAAATGHASLFLAVAIFGLGGPLVSVGAPKLISIWFGTEERGMAMGIYITGPAVGGILALALTNGVLMPLLGDSWRLVLLSYAGLVLFAGLVWFVIAGHPASTAVERTPAAWQKRPQLAVFAGLLRIPIVQLALLLSVGVFFFNHGLNNWLPEILRAGGMSAAEAGYWAALPTLVGIAGALIIPRLATPARRIGVLTALFVCAGVATVLIQQSTDWVVASGLFLQGVARSAMMPVAVLLLMEAKEIGAKNMGAAGGLFFTSAEIGGVLGPLTLGYVAERSGGFAAPLHILLVDCVLLAVLMVFVRRATSRQARQA